MNQTSNHTRTPAAVKTQLNANDKTLISPNEKLLSQIQATNQIALNDLDDAGWIRVSAINGGESAAAKLYPAAATRRFSTLLVSTSSPPGLAQEEWIKPLGIRTRMSGDGAAPPGTQTHKGNKLNADAETTKLHREMLDIARGQVIGAAAGARLAALAAHEPMSKYLSDVNSIIAASYKRELVAAMTRLHDLELSAPAAHASASKTVADSAEAAAFSEQLKTICDHDEEIGDDSADDLAAVCAMWGDDLVIVATNPADADDTDVMSVADAYIAYENQAK